MPEDLHKSGDDLSSIADAGSPAETTELPVPRIAVLPFSNTSGDPDQDHFGVGIAAEILICLTSVPGFHLVARSQVFALKRDETEPRDLIGEIDRQLHATAALRGTVKMSAGKISVTAELMDVKANQPLWFAMYERNLQDVFIILDEIIAGVVCALDSDEALDGVRKIQSVHTGDVEAYDRYLRGRQFYFWYSRFGVESALELFQEAIVIDEEYALAYCGIADCYSYLYMYVESSDANREEAEKASLRALELDPLLAEAHASCGLARSLRLDFEASESAFEKAIELDPKLFEAHYYYARACFVQGKLEKAIKHFDAAHRTRPEDYQTPLLTGQIYDSLAQPEKAAAVRREGVEVAERHLKFHPHDTRALYMAANGLVVLGEKEKGLEWLQLALSLEPDDGMLLYNAGCIYALAELQEEALTCLERTVAGGLTQREWYEHDSNLDSLRTHPRFEALLAGMV